MKTSHLRTMLGLAAAAVLASSALAEKIVAGPKGGRLLDKEPAPVEFFVNADKKAEVLFYSPDLKPANRAQQAVTVTAERPGGRVAVELVPTTGGFVSKNALPEGTPYRVVVQVRSTPDARPKNYRIDLNLAHCGGCKRAEYACTCESH